MAHKQNMWRMPPSPLVSPLSRPSYRILLINTTSSSPSPSSSCNLNYCIVVWNTKEREKLYSNNHPCSIWIISQVKHEHKTLAWVDFNVDCIYTNRNGISILIYRLTHIECLYCKRQRVFFRISSNFFSFHFKPNTSITKWMGSPAISCESSLDNVDILGHVGDIINRICSQLYWKSISLLTAAQTAVIRLLRRWRGWNSSRRRSMGNCWNTNKWLKYENRMYIYVIYIYKIQFQLF